MKSATAASNAREASPWSPLRHAVFRTLWVASLVSNIGTWMHEVGEAWLMTSLAPSPLMVALLRTASSLPFFLIALPSGALADIVDRRRLLLLTQGFMLFCAAVLAVLTHAGVITPTSLLTFTFLMGLGQAMNTPAWQANIPELVPREELPAAVALGGISNNLARVAGPAIGGLIVAVSGPAMVFFVNALSFVGVLIALYFWRREKSESSSPAERVVGAMEAGVRYVRHSPSVKIVLLRVLAFVSCASGLWALMPLVARNDLGRGSAGYGALLGSFGLGAVLAALALPYLRRRLGTDRMMTLATVMFAAATFGLAYVRVFFLLCALLVVGGYGWLTMMSSFNVATQRAVAAWVRARALAIYLLAFTGAMAAGSAVWGSLAQHVGIPRALGVAGVGLLLNVFLVARFPLEYAEEEDLSPSLDAAEPTVVSRPGPHDGPVLITVEYLVDPADQPAFAEAMQDLRRIRQRDGAIFWGLYRDLSEERRYLETFIAESWAEHMRQHARLTVADRAVQSRVRTFHRGTEPPLVAHLIAADAGA